MPVVRILHRSGNFRDLLPLATHPAIDAIEADIWVRGDQIVANHNRPLGPLPFTIGPKGIHREPNDPVHLPEIVSAVGAANPHSGLVLDLRSWLADPAPDLARALLRLPDRSHVIVSCEVWSIADRLRAWVPDLRVAYSIRSEPQLRRFVARGIDGRAEPVTVAIRESLLHSLEEVHSLKRYAREVTAWTVDDADRGLKLAAWGVDGVVSNHVAVLNSL